MHKATQTEELSILGNIAGISKKRYNKEKLKYSSMSRMVNRSKRKEKK